MSAAQQILAGIKGVIPPSITVAPVITGTATVGQTLSCSTGSWAGTNPSFTYQWQQGTTNISGKTLSTYLVEAAYAGVTLRCVVTATNSAGGASANSASTGAVAPAPGQVVYTTPGAYSWTAPAGVTSVSVVCVSAGDPGSGPDDYSGGRGGSLAYLNNFTVTPGNSYSLQIGGDTYFQNNTTVRASMGVVLGTGGGLGGTGGGWTGGGGAGGYSGAGGNAIVTVGENGNGGGGGGGGELYGGGGGVGLLGQGSNGVGGAQYLSGTGGSGGATGTGVSGGLYGGGGSGAGNGSGVGGIGGAGAVRIIWPGTTRQFPSTNTTNM